MDTTITDGQAERYNALYSGALRLVRPNILIDGEPQAGAPGWLARRRLRRGIEGFGAALAIAPFKWECKFWIGKALQRLGEHREAMGWFVEALKHEPDNPSIAKEGANEALSLGDFRAGIALLRPATELRPHDPVLHYDLAIHLLLAGQPQEAYHALRTAARLEAHPHTARLMTMVEDVMTGRRPCPRSVTEIQRGT